MTGRGLCALPMVVIGLACLAASAGWATMCSASVANPPTPPGPLETPACGPGDAAGRVVGRPTQRLSWTADLQGRVLVHARLGGAATRAVTPAEAGSLPVLAAALGSDGRCWLRVGLSRRPNRASGWIDAADVGLRSTPWRIEVRIDTRTATLWRAGDVVQRWRAVVGAPSTPTPQGRYALLDAWSGDASGFYGRWVITLSAHSNALRRFEGGDGRVAVHGRGGTSLRDPLGSARSHGCVRLSNEAVSTLVERIGRIALPGTPIEIG